MSDNFEFLSASQHASLRISPQRNFLALADQVFLPLALEEAVVAGRCMPLVLSGDEAPKLVALLGLGKGHCRAVGDDGSWRLPYAPAAARRLPLALAPPAEDGGEQVVVIDVDSVELNPEGGEPLFGEDGQPGPVLQERIRLLEALVKKQAGDERILGEIADQDVLVEREVSVGEGEQRQVLLQGFRVVDQERLNELEDAVLADWARRGVLRMIHAHLESLDLLQEWLD